MKIFKLLLAAGLLIVLVLTRCGPGNGTNPACIPNVIEAGASMDVEPLTGNVYTFQFCQDLTPSGVFTVYGGVDQTSVSQGSINLNAAYRASHLTETSAGTTFQVTFQPSDTAFAIYQDSVTNTYSSSIEIVSPHTLPGH